MRKRHGSFLTFRVLSIAPPQTSQPPGCIVCLEDMKGDVARDVQGRPIIVVVGGIMHGTAQEMQMQALYAVQRAALYCHADKHAPGQALVILETTSRKRGDKVAFSIPDFRLRSVSDMVKRVFPGAHFGNLHFCGLPRYVIAAFHLVRPFLSSDLYQRLFLKQDFSHLVRDGHATPDNLLAIWDKGGTFEFDLDDYVEWRAREEGVEDSQICPRGFGRQYTEDDSMICADDLLGDEEKIKAGKVIKYGSVQKQGSGLGIFGSRKWKKKLMVVFPTVLIYFDSAEISKTNKASRIIPLDPSSSVKLLPDVKENMTGLCINALGRDFMFGIDSREEAVEWETAIRQAFHSHDDD